MNKIIVLIVIFFGINSCNINFDNNEKKAQPLIELTVDSTTYKEIYYSEVKIMRSQEDSTYYKLLACFYNNNKDFTLRVRYENNILTILRKGLNESNDSIVRTLSGKATAACMGDVDADRCPELFVTIEGLDKRKSLIAYSCNQEQSMIEIDCSAFNSHPELFEGYRDQDHFEIVDNTCVYSFPIYKKEGELYVKTDKERIIRYKLDKRNTIPKIVYLNFIEN